MKEKKIEHKGKIKGFGSQVQKENNMNFVIFQNGQEVFLPKDLEVTISWTELEK